MVNWTTLLLNSTYEPLQVISWQRAVTMVYLGKVEVVRSYGRRLRAVSWSVLQPAVVRLVSFVGRHRQRVSFSRRNIFLRDGFRCQYCGGHFTSRELTCDHVIPRSLGGQSSWDNLATACEPCNRKKGGRTPEQARMRLRRQPRRPDHLPFGEALAIGGSARTPELWREFLDWQN